MDAQSLVRSLLCREPEKRLFLPPDYAVNHTAGSADGSPLHLQNHAFFADMHFPSLLSYTHSGGYPNAGYNPADASSQVHVMPPYVPPKPKDIYDTCNFDTEFTKLAANLSIESLDDEPATEQSEGEMTRSDSTSSKKSKKGDRSKSREVKVSLPMMRTLMGF